MTAPNLQVRNEEAPSEGSFHQTGILDVGHHSESSRSQTIIEDLIQAQVAEKSIHDILVDLGTPFVSLAVLEEGRITAKIIGPPSSSSSDSTLNNDTIFQAASISKPITAMAVVKLCQEGKLDLDSPISEYLSQDQILWFSTPKTLPLASQITLRQLLSHTSGLSCHGVPGYATIDVPTVEQILRGDGPSNNEPITMAFVPGQGSHYSGGGLTVVQLILEVRLGKPFYELMDELVLRPLEMTRSIFKFLPESEKNYAPAHMNGIIRSNPDHHNFPERAAAGLWTTPTDLLKAIRAMQKSLDSGGFLERKWAQEMLTEVERFGIGWRAKKGEGQFGHSGSNDPGYLSFVGGFAELPHGDDDKVEKKAYPKDCGIGVMTSSVLGMVVIEKIVAAVAYVKNWPAIPELESVPFMDRKKTIDQKAKEWCGKWGPGDWTLFENHGLFIQVGKFPPMPLVAAACPPQQYDEGSSIDLVIDGLEMMLRLGWKEKARIIEVWQEGDIRSLERLEKEDKQ
ncbi:beta-lactamase/transpeptidase-like protein [Mollisia scopiformis]|uniref:Beta-lactamase/transpeptidase-like protein n=1 Tax=Mollisia scopiformis TaxID=149040 RepID=A0A194X0G5_MOLSC|nr:beta-lactamase/transpeptidase-like protein [Mollisia scopiformis]KUJ13688.1 beta-lactamase/transpeptidase-like protein [Mollisia scopiformis]